MRIRACRVGWFLILAVTTSLACNHRAGVSTSWNASRGTVGYFAEGRVGMAGQLDDEPPRPENPQGFMVAPEFGVGFGIEEGEFRLRTAIALPSYKYVDGAWGTQMAVDFVSDFGADDRYGFGPQLRLGVLREVRRRDYEMDLVALDLTAGHLFGDRDGWIFGVSGSFGLLGKEPSSRGRSRLDD